MGPIREKLGVGRFIGKNLTSPGGCVRELSAKIYLYRRHVPTYIGAQDLFYIRLSFYGHGEFGLLKKLHVCYEKDFL